MTPFNPIAIISSRSNCCEYLEYNLYKYVVTLSI
jgi:hypothetical protein